ncbi:MAG: hypothetical protein AAFO07_33155 [Bacteroidota bacterium]
MDDDTPPFEEFGELFDNLDNAKEILLKKKDLDLAKFRHLISDISEINLSPEPKILNPLEELYYNIFIDKSKKMEVERAEFENLLSLYFMHILVEKNIARWGVDRNPFSKNRYNLIIEFSKDYNTTGGFATELFENEADFGRNYLVSRMSEYVSL